MCSVQVECGLLRSTLILGVVSLFLFPPAPPRATARQSDSKSPAVSPPGTSTSVPRSTPTPLQLVDSPELSIAAVISKAAHDGSLTRLHAALAQSGLLEVLDGPGPVTLFAPTDEAFEKRFGPVGSQGSPSNADFRFVLSCHIVRGEMKLAEIRKLSGSGATAVSLAGLPVGVSKQGRFETATILQADVKAANGVIHTVDEIIGPEPNVSASRSDLTP